MEILPAIDLRGGKCVRLLQGDYDRETVFGDDPAAMARRWESLGAPRLHVVDLDGARRGRPQHLDVLKRMVGAVSIPLQFGGGVRDLPTARRVVATGVDRVVTGTRAWLDARRGGHISIMRAIPDSPNRLVAGIDARNGKVAVRAWTRATEWTALDLAKKLVAMGIRIIVYTDISSDGMLQGANVDAMREMIESVPEASVIASGGVTTVEDVRKLKEAGAAGVIIGMALYSGKLTLKDALEAAC